MLFLQCGLLMCLLIIAGFILPPKRNADELETPDEDRPIRISRSSMMMMSKSTKLEEKPQIFSFKLLRTRLDYDAFIMAHCFYCFACLILFVELDPLLQTFQYEIASASSTVSNHTEASGASPSLVEMTFTEHENGSLLSDNSPNVWKL